MRLLFFIILLTLAQINFAAPPLRIISLAPSLTEMLFSVGAGDEIKGVMAGCDYPVEAKKIPVIASYNHLNVEAILALKPSLILVWDQAHFANDLTLLHSFGIPIVYSHPQRLQDIPWLLIRLGKLTNTTPIANQAANRFAKQFSAMVPASHVKKVRVFYELWAKPLMTITRHSEINQMIEICGGENIFRNVQGSAPIVSLEATLLANPEVIFSSQPLDFWQQWPELDAVRHHHVYWMNPDWIERPGVRNLSAVALICQKLKEVRGLQSI